MTQYVVRRLIGMMPTLLILLFMVVAMVQLVPGNIVDIIMEEASAGPTFEEDKAQLEAHSG